MVDTAAVTNWVEAYKKAWASSDPKDIAPLFSAGAAYYTSPFADPIKGNDAIVNWWDEHRDAPSDYTFQYEVLGTGADCGVVRGWTIYNNPKHVYSNIWLIRLNDAGRCTEFTEWHMAQPKQ